MLSESLKSETQELHTAVERSMFVQALFRGELERPAYALFLRNLREIYAALESAIVRQPSDSPVRLVWSAALTRLPSLELDLEALYGRDWSSVLTVLPVTSRYVVRLAALSAHEPDLLVAHAYVRYLGDLNGGQVLARVVTRRFGASRSGGVAFYDFGPAEAVARLKKVFREGLDKIGRTTELAGPIVAEAQLAFRLHAELFEELVDTGSTA